LPERLRDLLGLGAALLVGAAVFFVYCGWWVLLPTNIAWLDTGDRAMHQLGWMFYRAAPWEFPPGRSPLLGLELANSIALVDGLPLFAIPFKLVAAWLPTPFQYWGAWLLAVFVLQSAFAYRLARELGAGRRVALAAAAFALITPAFLFRVPMHMALSGHFVLLAALFLYVRRDAPAGWMWPLLAAVTAAIHGTLLAMVLALWFAALLERIWRGRFGDLQAVRETALVCLATAATLYLVGFFGTGSYGTYGYGAYKLNLLWPALTYGWSQLVPDLAHTRFDYEGLSFPGIGIAALLVVAALSGALLGLRAAATRRWLPLAAMLLALMIFAVSKTPSFGPHDLADIPVPPLVDALGSAFRSTGRFVWPLLYLVTIGAVVLVGRRFRPAVALPLLLLAFIAQAVDSAPAWRAFAAGMARPAPSWLTPLVSPFWERAADAGYRRLRAIPIEGGFGSDWQALGYYAVTHGMDTDIAYLGRVDGAAHAALAAAKVELLETGAFEAHTLYVLGLPAALATLRHLEPGDLLATIDGRIVFARGGAELIEGLGIANTPTEGGRWLPPVAYGGSHSR